MGGNTWMEIGLKMLKDIYTLERATRLIWDLLIIRRAHTSKPISLSDHFEIVSDHFKVISDNFKTIKSYHFKNKYTLGQSN